MKLAITIKYDLTFFAGVSSHNHKMSNSHSVTSKDSGIQLLQSDSGAATGGPGSESGKTSSSTSSSMSLSHRLASLNLTGGGGGGTAPPGGGGGGGGGARDGPVVPLVKALPLLLSIDCFLIMAHDGHS